MNDRSEPIAEMNGRFVAALEQAFCSGQEHRKSACAEFGEISNGSPALAWQRARQLTATVHELLYRPAAGGLVYEPPQVLVW